MRTDVHPPADIPPVVASQKGSVLMIRVGIFLLLVAIATLTSIWIQPIDRVTDPGVVLELPDVVEAFVGTDQEISEAERVILPEDTGFAKKNYLDPEGRSIVCQIVLAGADRRSIHRPELCLAGQGWTISSGEVIPIDLNSGNKLDVMALTISRPVTVGGESRTLSALYLYWFVSDHNHVARHLERVMLSNYDLLVHNRANRWAYVIVTAPILEGFEPGGLNRDETLEMLTNFIRSSVPEFQKSEMSQETAAN